MGCFISGGGCCCGRLARGRSGGFQERCLRSGARLSDEPARGGHSAHIERNAIYVVFSHNEYVKPVDRSPKEELALRELDSDSFRKWITRLRAIDNRLQVIAKPHHHHNSGIRIGLELFSSKPVLIKYIDGVRHSTDYKIALNKHLSPAKLNALIYNILYFYK